MDHANSRLALHVWCLGAALLCMASCGSDYSDTANLSSTGTNIICFGDSITRGFGASEGMTYPDRLSSMIGGPVINAGVDGDTTASALQRLEEDVLSQDPWIVIIHLAGNDLVHRVPESETRKNLDTIVERCIDAAQS